jgi:hypothetical protein
MPRVLLALAFLAGVSAECPNACSGHGDCGTYDQCACYRNWQGEDCSLRTCPFGLAHVDSPKGDLDMSADSLSGPGTTVLKHSTVYPYGVQEQFPNMTTTGTTWTNGKLLSQSAHYYMECSNKGICDRKAGECECFDGYDGSACQRASCPNECSGHGTCEHVKTMAALESGNMYDLWDAEMTMGCVCDAGYTGPDCSGKACKYGIDPLYVDDEATARVETIKYKFAGSSLSGTYALKFFDVFGEDYQTMPIDIRADCYTVEDALDGLPNTVIPDDSIVCVSASAAAEQSYELTFTGNPGYLKQLFVDTYLDGDRETISSSDATGVTTNTYNTGISGALTDYFASQCKGVYAEIKGLTSGAGIDGGSTTATAAIDSYTSGYYANELNSGYYLSLTSAETKLLKICLGDADGVTSNDVEVYQWDYGSFTELADGNIYVMDSYPHAIKLVKVDPYDDYDGGYYYLTWWGPEASESGKFYLANVPSDATIAGAYTYAVYTTDGIVEKVIVDMDGDKELTQVLSSSTATAGTEARVTAYFSQYSNVLYTSYDTACETAFSMVEPCLDKGDMLFVIQSNYMQSEYSVVNGGTGSVMAVPSVIDEESGNLYTIMKIYKEDPTDSTFYREDRFRIVVDKNIPFAGTDLSAVNAFAKGSENTSHTGIVNLFKFSPATTGNYEYVSECSNRGTCDEGTCACFKGYTDDDCNVQSSLAV